MMCCSWDMMDKLNVTTVHHLNCKAIHLIIIIIQLYIAATDKVAPMQLFSNYISFSIIEAKSMPNEKLMSQMQSCSF